LSVEPDLDTELSVVILGAGAVGGYLGARLISAGCNVSFLVRETRAAQLRARGLSVESPLGDFSAPVDVVTRAEECPGPDLVVLTCKAFDLESALAAVAPVLAPETRLLPMLNGVRHIDLILERRLPGILIGGIAHGALTQRPDGVIAHLSPFMTMIAGPLTGAPDRVLDRLVHRLGNVHVDAKTTADIRAEMWAKFVFLTTLAGMTCLMRAGIGTIVATPSGERLITRLFDECLAVAAAEGFPLQHATADSFRSLLTDPGSTLTASMLRDIQGGKPIEAEQVLGDMLRRAVIRGVTTPLLEVACTHVRAYERERSR
jgi:2-dehydropantoate 2-reductase